MAWYAPESTAEMPRERKSHTWICFGEKRLSAENRTTRASKCFLTKRSITMNATLMQRRYTGIVKTNRITSVWTAQKWSQQTPKNQLALLVRPCREDKWMNHIKWWILQYQYYNHQQFVCVYCIWRELKCYACWGICSHHRIWQLKIRLWSPCTVSGNKNCRDSNIRNSMLQKSPCSSSWQNSKIKKYNKARWGGMMSQCRLCFQLITPDYRDGRSKLYFGKVWTLTIGESPKVIARAGG